MELGPLQKEWVQSLRDHPERQMSHSLGRKSEQGEGYKACCLGELHVIACRKKGVEPFSNKGRIRDAKPDNDEYQDPYAMLEASWEEYGLIDNSGRFLKAIEPKLELANTHKEITRLAQMNDSGYNWTEIADYIEKNPDNVFTKSV